MAESPEKPHGLDYSLTLHEPDGERSDGFDRILRQGSAGNRELLRVIAGKAPGSADELARIKRSCPRQIMCNSILAWIADKMIVGPCRFRGDDGADITPARRRRR